MILFECPSCNHTLNVDDTRGGQAYRCPHCNQQATIPDRRDKPGSSPAKPTAPELTATVAGPAERTSAEAQGSIAEMPTVGGELSQGAPAEGKGLGSSTSVPGYEIQGVLGRGGMGVVYKARQRGLNRLVALKMILGGAHAGAVELARFRAEAEAVARLQHPNIVQVYEVGAQNELPFFSLEFVDGGPLDKRLQGTPLPPREAAGLTATLARAVHSAHERGIVHRDLKPANILLTSSVPKGGKDQPGETSPYACTLNGVACIPKITDFGLAKQLDSADLGHTRSGAIMGTPSYMAPEQAAGKKDVGPLADVYALGSLLYEFLTGRPPFKGATIMDTILQVANDEPVPPSRLQPRLPRDLESICLRCLEKEPARRYKSAEALADDLERFLQGEPTRARPIANWERAWKWARRRPALASLLLVSLVAGASLVALLVGAVFWTELQASWQSEQEMRLVAVDKQREAERQEALAVGQKREAEKQRKEALTQRQLAEEQRALVRQLLYLAQIGLVDRAAQNGQFEDALDRLRGQEPSSGQEDLRRFEWYYLYRLCDRRLSSYRGHGLTVNGVAFSPDGLVVYSSADDMVHAWDARTGKEVSSFKTGAPVEGLALSADGKRLATPAGRTVKVWEARTGTELLTCTGHAQPVQVVAFSKDGQRLVSGSSDRTAKIWDARTGKETLTFRRHNSALRTVAFRPDGKQVASADGSQLLLWNPATGEDVVFLNGHTEPVNRAAFSADGAWLASASDDATVKVWDTRSGQDRLTFRGHTGPVVTVACSPAGTRAASADADGTIKLWDAQTGQEVLTIRGHRERITAVAFDPEGELLTSASTDKTAKVWDIRPDRAALRLTGLAEPAGQLAFSPDGRIVAAASTGSVKLWDARNGKDLPGAAGKRSVAFSPPEAGEGKSGGQVAAADGPTIRVWEPRSGKPVAQWQAHADGVRWVASSKDGSRLASLGEDGTVRMWDPGTGKALLTLKEFAAGAEQLAFSADGKRLAATGAHAWACRVCDAQTGTNVLNLSGLAEQVHSAVFSPDGQRLATANLVGVVKIWDLNTGKISRSWKGDHAPINFVTFSPDGRQLLSGDEFGVQVWNAATSVKVRYLPGGKRAVFSPDGQRLAVSDGQFIKLYEAQTGQEILSLRGQAGVVLFSPDGRALATAGADKTVRIWGGTSGR